ncbi:MAG: hypothetical protein GY754_07310 [bacterium]|nr:hypothetical protein [bacterium]
MNTKRSGKKLFVLSFTLLVLSLSICIPLQAETTFGIEWTFCLTKSAKKMKEDKTNTYFKKISNVEAHKEYKRNNSGETVGNSHFSIKKMSEAMNKFKELCPKNHCKVVPENVKEIEYAELEKYDKTAWGQNKTDDYGRPIVKILFTNVKNLKNKDFEFRFFTDPGAIEMNADPLTLKLANSKEMKANGAFIFKTMKSLNIAPDSKRGTGGGHINIGLESFAPKYENVINFITYLSNHPNFLMGALRSCYSDKMPLTTAKLYNAPMSVFSKKRREKYSEMSKHWYTKIKSEKGEKRERVIEALALTTSFVYKYLPTQKPWQKKDYNHSKDYAIAFESITEDRYDFGDIPQAPKDISTKIAGTNVGLGRATIEVRCVAPQQSYEHFLAQTKLFYQVVEHIKKQSSAMKFTEEEMPIKNSCDKTKAKAYKKSDFDEKTRKISKKKYFALKKKDPLRNAPAYLTHDSEYFIREKAVDCGAVNKKLKDEAKKIAKDLAGANSGSKYNETIKLIEDALYLDGRRNIDRIKLK